jgi:hypothetical protein
MNISTWIYFDFIAFGTRRWAANFAFMFLAEDMEHVTKAQVSRQNKCIQGHYVISLEFFWRNHMNSVNDNEN